MISEQQAKAFEVLKSYNVNVSYFIRDAIKEKIKRDWPKVKEEHNKMKLPF